jgi:cell wall-associated NlpC family hydrolase
MARRVWGFLTITALISSSSVPATGAQYTVRKGDTVWEIARKNKVSVSSVLRANGLKETSTLALGRTLTIPGKSGSAPARTVKRTTSVCRPAAASARIRSEGVYLRSGPSTRQQVVAKLHAGTSVRVIGTCGSWRKVVVSGGATGFVYAPLLCTGALPSECSRSTAAVAAQRGTGNSELIRTALACRGARYSRGGTGRRGFDCSGFTQYVFSKYGVRLPHSSAAQARLGTPVSRQNLAEGDLVFFRTYRRGVSHVGIYTGGGQFVHAATYGRGVRVDSLNHSYYAPRYMGARRVR